MKKCRCLKQTITVILVVSLLSSFCMALGMSITAVAYTAHSQSEAVSWAAGKIGTQVGSGQCPALISAYYQYLGVAAVSGNGKDYITNALPAGWQRISKSNMGIAQPGDIAVWSSTSTTLGKIYGHVAIVESATATQLNCLDQGNSSGNKVRRSTYQVNSSSMVLWGVIRPDWTIIPPVDPVTYYEVKESIFNIYSKQDPSFILNAKANPGTAKKNTEIVVTNVIDGTGEQKFRFQKYSDLTYYIRCESNSSEFCVNANTGSRAAAQNGDKVHLWEYNTINTKLWKFEAVDGGYYYVIRNASNTSLCLTVDSFVRFGAVTVRTYTGADNQKWQLKDLAHTHSYGPGVVTTKNTCTTNGVMTYTCSCGQTRTETIPATGHAYMQTVKAATCTEAGVKTFTCSICGNKYTESIAAIGHDYGAWNYLDLDQHHRICKNDASHKDTAKHTWDSGSITTQATCTESGIRTFTCTVCNGTKTETIPEIGHDFGEWQQLDEEQHQRVCKNDSTHVEKKNHTWNDGDVTIEPTEESEGEMCYKCSVCGAVKTEPIEKLKNSEKKGKIIVGSATASAGSTVTIAIKLEKSIPVNVIRGALTYDSEALELVVAPEKGDLFDDFKSGKSLVWTAKQNVEDAGILALLTFKVDEKAEKGKYEIVFNPYDASNKETENVAFDVENGYITVSDAICGDVNGDGVIDPKDLSRLLTYFVEYDYVTKQSSITVSAGADVNGDGEVTAKDLSRLLTYFVEYDYVTKTSPVKLGE